MPEAKIVFAKNPEFGKVETRGSSAIAASAALLISVIPFLFKTDAATIIINQAIIFEKSMPKALSILNFLRKGLDILGIPPF